MTISQKLIDVNTAKTNIKAAIEAKGVDTTGVPFTNYHTKIAEIQTGGGGTPTATPTISMPTSFYSGAAITGTISNFVLANQTTYSINIRNTVTNTIVASDSDLGGTMSDNKNGSFTGPTNLTAASNTYQVEVQGQDFGATLSPVATFAFDINAFDFTARYWRINNLVQGIGYRALFVNDFSLYSEPNQTGTEYPQIMTSNTEPAPYVASGSYFYSATYDFWKAFDSDVNSSGYWSLGSPTFDTDYLQLDLGSQINVKSLRLRVHLTYTAEFLNIEASTTGAFAGEQSVIGTFNTKTFPLVAGRGELKLG